MLMAINMSKYDMIFVVFKKNLHFGTEGYGLVILRLGSDFFLQQNFHNKSDFNPLTGITH